MRITGLIFFALCLLNACKENTVETRKDDWLMKFEPRMGQTTFHVRDDSTIVINVILSDSTGSYPYSAIVKYPSWMSRLYSNGKDVGAFSGGFLPIQPSDPDQVLGSGIWLSDSIWNSQSRSGYFFIYKLR